MSHGLGRCKVDSLLLGGWQGLFCVGMMFYIIIIVVEHVFCCQKIAQLCIFTSMCMRCMINKLYLLYDVNIYQFVLLVKCFLSMNIYFVIM